MVLLLIAARRRSNIDEISLQGACQGRAPPVSDMSQRKESDKIMMDAKYMLSCTGSRVQN